MLLGRWKSDSWRLYVKMQPRVHHRRFPPPPALPPGAEAAAGGAL